VKTVNAVNAVIFYPASSSPLRARVRAPLGFVICRAFFLRQDIL
jgi:hypothetical protein